MLFQPEADLMAPPAELNKTVKIQGQSEGASILHPFGLDKTINIQGQSEGASILHPFGLDILFQPEADLMAPPAKLNKN